jgi:hypothetical protein
MTAPIKQPGRILAAMVVTALYWFYGAALVFILFAMSAVFTLNFFWLSLFRPLFYIPGVIAVVYLYFFKKKRGLFSESLAFLLILSLAMFLTLELIIYI